MKKRYSYRAYPTVGQEKDLAQLFGCVRVVYNDYLGFKQDEWKKNRELPRNQRTYTPDGEVAKAVTTLAKQTEERGWLSDVSAVPLQQVVRDARSAYRGFFQSITAKRKGPKVGAPRFKSKRGKSSARFTRTGFKVHQTTHGVGKVYLAKIGWVRFVLSRELTGDPTSVTIIRKADGTYEVSFVVEVEPETSTPKHPGRVAGVDLGLTDFATIVYSDGTREKVANPRHLKKAQRKLRKAQQSLARKVGPDKRTKQNPSNNWKKQQKKVARAYSAVAHRRSDFHNKLVHRLTYENQGVVVERLNVLGLSRAGAKGARGRGLRRSVGDVGWGTFLAKLADKSQELGRDFEAIDPAYTSQTCSLCGVIDGPKPLNIRTWECGSCGAALDRDYNAAVNILVAGGQPETINACGADVRQEPESPALAICGEARTRRSEPELVA